MTNQEELHLETTEAQYWVEQKASLDRLMINKDFKAIILEGYFKDRALDQVSLLGTDYVKKNGLRAELMEALVAISVLQDHFATIQNLGANAEAELQDIDGPDVAD